MLSIISPVSDIRLICNVFVISYFVFCVVVGNLLVVVLCMVLGGHIG